jgi:hypothetical protein
MKAVPYEDMPWLTEERLTTLLEEAYELGECQFHYYPPSDGGVDWDYVFDRLEKNLPWEAGMQEDGVTWVAVELPGTYDHPLMNKIKREYRKGYKENNE